MIRDQRGKFHRLPVEKNQNHAAGLAAQRSSQADAVADPFDGAGNDAQIAHPISSATNDALHDMAQATMLTARHRLLRA